MASSSFWLRSTLLLHVHSKVLNVTIMQPAQMLANMGRIVYNEMQSRAAWIAKLMDPRRNISAECGHPLTLTTEDYMLFYERNDIANRIISLYPDESWQMDPEIFETDEKNTTPFEKAWNALNEEMSPTTALQQADVTSGIGRFGILLMGFDDGGSLEQPVTKAGKLLYLRPLDESLVKVQALVADVRDPRYGMPEMYEVTFEDASILASGNTTTETVKATVPKKVHWTRVIHLADNRLNSLIYGVPRLKWVVNRVLDLQKVAGGSGEMFWKGGFPGLSVETQQADDLIEFDAEATKEQMIAYMNGLQRYIATQGMTVKSLAVQIAEPSKHVETQIRLISIALACPWRIFMGAEVGQLASEQDVRAWNGRIDRRRRKYINPNVIIPFIDRLIKVGVLPPLQGDRTVPKIAWNDLNSPSDLDKATVAEKKTKALLNYVQGGLDAVIPEQEYFTLVFGLDEKAAQAIVTKAKAAGNKTKFKLPKPTNTVQTSATRPAPGNS